MENKLASSLVVPLGKALSGIFPSWCGIQMAGNFNRFLVNDDNYATTVNTKNANRPGNRTPPIAMWLPLRQPEVRYKD